MADPFTLLTIASATVGAVGSIAAGQATAAAETERALVAERNAEIAEQNAQRAEDVGQIEAQEQDFLTLSMLGTQESRQAASGLSGRSQQLARKTARELGRRDALNITADASVRAFNFRTEAADRRSEARVARLSGDNALLSGFLDAGSTLISGAARTRRGPTPRFEPFRRRA